MNKLAIDLTWVRHKKVGGTESYIINVLDGLAYFKKNNIVLLVAKDNEFVFDKFKDIFDIIVCQCNSANQIKRLIWQNFHLGKVLKQNSIYYLFEPTYYIPRFGIKNVSTISTIHDLQAMHFPSYFSKFRCIWMKKCWKRTVKNSVKIIAISKCVKDDIIESFNVNPDKVCVIYNSVNVDEKYDENIIRKYHLKCGEYFYTVSSMLPHKNLITILKMMALYKAENPAFERKLVISGVGGKSKEELIRFCEENNISNNLVLTDFVSDSERNSLYKNCYVFLFSSVFEGFGMPPIEAACYGAKVLTTKRASLEEVTMGYLNYVNDPYDPGEWKMKIDTELSILSEEQVLSYKKEYSLTKIAKDYINLFDDVMKR